MHIWPLVYTFANLARVYVHVCMYVCLKICLCGWPPWRGRNKGSTTYAINIYCIFVKYDVYVRRYWGLAGYIGPAPLPAYLICTDVHRQNTCTGT